MSSKQCFKCLCSKPLSEFYVHKMMADGHLNKCKECTKADVHASEWKYKAQRAEARKKPHRAAHLKAYHASWIAQHPERRAAQIAVGNALNSGRLVPLPCWVCGAQAHAHHPDYSHPLDVVWLCPTHHKQAHQLAERTSP